MIDRTATTVSGYHYVESFLPAAERADLLRLIQARTDLLREVSAPANLGPRYRVIDGEQIQRDLPALHAYGEGALRRAVEQLTGMQLQLMASPKRAMHVQVYGRPGDGFRWHFDGHRFAALLTLCNSGGGATEVVPPTISRWLRAPLYALYPWPQVFSRMPATRIAAAPGDLLVLHGRRVLHRGPAGNGGERWIAAFNYDAVGERPNRRRDWLARRINY